MLLCRPLLVAGPDVGNTQIEEAIHSIQSRGRVKKDLRLVGSRATAGIENDPRVSQIDVARLSGLITFPPRIRNKSPSIFPDPPR